MTGEKTRTIEVFYSYAHQDELLRNELETHLTALKRQGLITSWCDREIQPGKVREHEIDTHLHTAQIVLLLISADFLASDYCYSKEMKRALERHEAGEARVIPVLLRHAFWENAPFAKLQALPRNGKPIANWSGRQGRDKAFLEVAIGIREVIMKQWPSEKSIESEAQDSGDTSDVDFTSAPIDASNALVETQKANAHYELNHYDEALMEYTLAIHLDPDYVLPHRGMGDALYKLKRYDEALAAYDQALQLDPDDINVNRDKGALLYDLKRYEGALAIYEHILRLHAEDSGASYSKGVVYLRLAQQAFEKAQQLRNSIANKA
jgi:tetratricopeptide (TPR) repeat protein